MSDATMPMAFRSAMSTTLALAFCVDPPPDVPPLPGRLLELRGLGRRIAELVDEALDRAQRRVAGERGSDRVDDLRARERRRQRDDRHAPLAEDGVGLAGAAHDDVGAVLVRERGGLVAVAGLRDDVEARVLEHESEVRPDGRVALHGEYGWCGSLHWSFLLGDRVQRKGHGRRARGLIAESGALPATDTARVADALGGASTFTGSTPAGLQLAAILGA